MEVGCFPQNRKTSLRVFFEHFRRLTLPIAEIWHQIIQKSLANYFAPFFLQCARSFLKKAGKID